MGDLKLWYGGPISIWTATSEKGRKFLGSEDKTVDPSQNGKIRNEAEEQGLVIIIDTESQ